MRKRLRRSPHIAGFLLWLLLTVSALVLLQLYASFPKLINLLLSLNVSSFLLFGLDKLQAVYRKRRIPERTLLFSAFAGGPIGALVAMNLFRHKTSKTSFQFSLAVVVLLEIAIVLYFFPNLLPTF